MLLLDHEHTNPVKTVFCDILFAQMKARRKVLKGVATDFSLSSKWSARGGGG
jgi:hypothetical protein